jgi:DNA-binding NtrC family response regulator
VEVHVSSVLIVDDEAPVRGLLRRWLAPAGYDLREAPDAETALSLLNAGASDVVISDVQMPGHDGLWLVEQIRGSFPRVAIVLATAVNTVPPAVSMQGGVVEYLVKPLDRERVVAAVSRACEWREGALAREPEPTAPGDPVADWLSRGRTFPGGNR